jgi:hypothetical protein
VFLSWLVQYWGCRSLLRLRPIMKRPFRKMNGPLWKLCLRIAGMAAAIWALYDMLHRHHLFSF